MAYSIATGEAFDLSGFNGGEETVRFFERHGYTVVQDTEKRNIVLMILFG